MNPTSVQAKYAVTIELRDAISTADDVQELKKHIVTAMTNQSSVAEVEVELISSSYGPCFHCGSESFEIVTIGTQQWSVCTVCALELFGVSL